MAPQPPADLPQPGEDAWNIAPLASSPDWAAAGAAFARLVLSWREWMHRRIEVITFVDQTVARREVSVDFTVPETVPALRTGEQDLVLVPLMRLPKRTLTNFDLVDETGKTMPMLARQQHQELATYALFITAHDEIENYTDQALEADAAELLSLCRSIATSPPGESDEALAAFYGLGLAEQGFSSRLARSMAESFFVTVQVPAVPGQRRVLKFSYDEIVGDPKPRFLSEVARGAAWRAKPVWFPIPGISDAPSYHLEVQAPAGLWIVRRELFITDEPVVSRHGPYARARFYHRPHADTLGLATVSFRPQTWTVLRASALISWLATLLLLGSFFALWWGGFRDNDSNVPGLLLFLPGVVSALLVRSGEHAMTTDMLWLVRVLTLIPGALAFLGGVAIAALPDGSPALLYLFGALALISYVPTAILTLSWSLCTFPTDPDRVKTRAAHTY